jgi:ElaB/YqjD/DUF883 family membrane-anchored ribosome-binding protein
MRPFRVAMGNSYMDSSSLNFQSRLSANKFRDFTNGVDYLLRRVVDSTDPDISRTRARLYIALTAAKDVMADGSTQALALAEAADQWVRRHPWQSVGLAAFAGAVAGVLVGRSRQ